MTYIQAITNGILIGSIYGFIAFGVTLIFGILRVINFTHGSLLMLAMYLAYAISLTGINPYLGIFVEAPVFYIFGYILQRTLFERVFKNEPGVREPMSALLLAFGLLVLFENVVLLVTGPDYRMAQTIYGGATFNISNILIKKSWLYGFIITVICYFFLSNFLKRTWLGHAIRAVGQDRDAARLMGIDHFKIFGVAFGIGMALLAVAGAILIPFFYIHPAVGWNFAISSFVIVILGGLGSVVGAFYGGIIVGIIDSIGAQFMSPVWTIVVTYSIFLLVLFLKPSGLFGIKEEF